MNATVMGPAGRAGLVLLCSLVLGSPAMAQEGEAEGREAEAHEAVEEGEEYLNGLNVLLGATTETDPTSTAFTVGVGYVRRLSPMWSVGAAGEFATSETLREWLLFVNGYIKPVGGLVLGTGPGIEGAKETEEDEETELSNAFAWRFVASWEFEVSRRFYIAPELNLDLIGGSVVWVYGLAFGVNF